jgi:hypothetical protein
MLRVLFVVVAFDLFLGGGGRLLDVGPVSLRMLLFAIALAVAAVHLVGRRGGWAAIDGQERLALGIVVAFLVTHAGAVAIGWLDGNDPVDIGTDVKPLLYVLIAPFFALCLKTPDDVRLAARLLRIAGPVLAVAYLAIWSALTLRVLDFAVVYPMLNDTGEFFFRGESFFFYKGFLYLGVGIVFLLAHRARGSLALAALVTVALVLTLTRGFALSTSIAVLALLTVRDRRILVAAIPVVAGVAFAVLAFLPAFDEVYLEQRQLSNTIRTGDWAFFVDNARPGMLLIGEGFGAVFNERLLFENTFLWVLWKAGAPALLFWLAPFAMATWWFGAAVRSPEHALLAAAWWCSVLLVYVQTSTNPFLSNPIGMSIVLMALLSLRVLALDATAAAPVPSTVPAAPRPSGDGSAPSHA